MVPFNNASAITAYWPQYRASVQGASGRRQALRGILRQSTILGAIISFFLIEYYITYYMS